MALAILVRLALTPLLADRFPFFLQFVVVLYCARYLGLVPGLASLGLGFAAALGRSLWFSGPAQGSGGIWLDAGLAGTLCGLAVWLLSHEAQLRREVESGAHPASTQAEEWRDEAVQREQQQAIGARLRAIVESSEDAIISKDLSGIIQSWNRGAEEMFGYTEAEAVGRPISLVVPPDRLNEEAEILERIRAGGRVKHFEAVRLHKSGREIHVSLTISPLRDARGAVTGASHIARDVTDRKLLEEQTRQTQKLESLGVLAGGLAHDFNNLLAAIMGNASLAMEEIGPENPLQPYLTEVMNSSERAAHLVREMLAYAGKGRFVVQALDLSRIIEEMAPLIRRSVPPTVTVEFRLAPALPALEGDAAQIQQLVMNLVVNAAEASGENGGEVRLTTSAGSAEARSEVLLQVEDTGCGMEEETRQRIFDPFFSTKFTGRGLGLPAVLGIVRGHSGSISVASVPGRGSVFSVAFPATGAGTAGKAPGSGRVLVVDDEEMLRQMVRLTLERSGYTVELAEGGASAVERFAAAPETFDAVLLDVTMPNMGGLETLERIRALSAEVPVILSSSFSEDEALGKFHGRGAADFLQKPYTPAMLKRALAQVIGEHCA